jgi:hypothetical protein
MAQHRLRTLAVRSTQQPMCGRCYGRRQRLPWGVFGAQPHDGAPIKRGGGSGRPDAVVTAEVVMLGMWSWDGRTTSVPLSAGGVEQHEKPLYSRQARRRLACLAMVGGGLACTCGFQALLLCCCGRWDGLVFRVMAAPPRAGGLLCTQGCAPQACR